MKKILFVSLLLFSVLFSFSQNNDQQQLLKNLQAHIQYLSSDDMEGRMTGSVGEQKAYQYIMMHFRANGILPPSGGTYEQAFDFSLGKKLSGNNFLELKGNSFALHNDFFPLSMSANGDADAKCVDLSYGIKATEIEYDDYKSFLFNGGENLSNKIFLINISNPEPKNSHSKYAPFTDLHLRVQAAKENGAAAVLFYNTDPTIENPDSNLKMKSAEEEIPVLFITNSVYEKLSSSKKKTVSLSVNMDEVRKTGHNVIGWIDNGAPYTVVIGGHYDHLGYGEEGGSLYRGTEKLIHNGADDNASGIALMIELGRELLGSNFKANNYLLIAFSGEELGLLGSNYFTKNPSIDLSKVNYMLNFDMVGRMDPKDYTVGIFGVGTSSSWTVVPKILIDSMKIKTTESGIGHSDHTSFYLNDIPALHFFSGIHEDYHKPTDDEYKINYSGILDINEYVLALIDSLNDNGKIDFQKTKEDTMVVPRFTTLKLGIVPDYLFGGKGLRVDGVTEGTPAFHAGLKTGDVIIKLGDLEITDMKSYMKAKSVFNKGDKTIVRFLRDGVEAEGEVQF